MEEAPRPVDEITLYLEARRNIQEAINRVRKLVPTRQYSLAVTKLQEALHWLDHRED